MRIVTASVLAGLTLTSLPLAASADAPRCGVLSPACNSGQAPSTVKANWRHFMNRAYSALGARHRARDLFMKQGGVGVVAAKFAYGPIDKDLEGEDVDAFLQPGCSGRWYHAGTFRTTDGKANLSAVPASIGQITDKGGRVFLDVSRFRLPVGRTRVRFVVRGDLTAAESWIEVLPSEAKIAVTDLDGTQTSSEFAVLGQLIGMDVAAHAYGPEAMTALAKKGYYPMYLTARPEWLMGATRQWLAAKGYPPGILRTTTTLTGINGSKATDYKVAEIRAVAASAGIAPAVGFGNKLSDVAAYKASGLPMQQTYYYQLSGDLQGGRRIDTYQTMLPIIGGLPNACR